MTDQTSTDPFLAQEQEFKDKIKAMHPAVEAALGRAEEVAKSDLLATVDGVKAEAAELEMRFKALLVRVEDLAHTGMTNNPLFQQAAKMITHIASIAKAL